MCVLVFHPCCLWALTKSYSFRRLGRAVYFGKVAARINQDHAKKLSIITETAVVLRDKYAIEESEDILRLYVAAEARKSAIAQTMAEMCAELGLIVAFFSGASNSRNNEKRLIPSIA